MRKSIFIILLPAIIFFYTGCATSSISSNKSKIELSKMSAEKFTEYVIGIRDVLDISIWQTDNLDEIKKMPSSSRQIGEYTIDIRDVLEISVWQSEELNKTVKVRPDGKISFPLVGDLKVKGLTPAQASKQLENLLAFYIKEPKVSVGITESGGKKVFVLGEVAHPGAYVIEVLKWSRETEPSFFTG